MREFIIPIRNSAETIASTTDSEGFVEGRDSGTTDGNGIFGKNRRVQGDLATPLYTYSTEEQIGDLNDVQVENICEHASSVIVMNIFSFSLFILLQLSLTV